MPRRPFRISSLACALVLAGSTATTATTSAAAPTSTRPKVDPSALSMPARRVHIRSDVQLEVTENGNPEFQHWQHAITIDFDEGRAVDFRVQTSASAAKSIRWELTRRGGFLGFGHAEAPVVLDSGTVKLAVGANKWQRFTIAFAKHAPKSTSKLDASAAKKAAGVLRATNAPANGTTATPFRSPLTITPRVYWLRATALDASNRPLGVASVPVRIVQGPRERTEAKLFPEGLAPPQAKLDPGLRASVTHYQPIQFAASDYNVRWVVTNCSSKPGGTFGAGTPFPSESSFGPPCSAMPIGKQFRWDPATPKDKSVIDVVEDAISDTIGFFGDAVNWASKAYADIKSFAVSQAAGLIPGCDSACRTALSSGLDIGLAAMGLPPSLPDFDQLTKMGEDYLVELISQEVVGEAGSIIASEVAEAGARALVKEARKRIAETTAHGGDGKRWFKPDPAFQHHDAYVVVKVTNTATTPMNGTLLVRVHGLFETAYVPVPAVAPGKSLTIPITLTPDYQYFIDKEIHDNHGVVTGNEESEWYDAYVAQTADIQVGGMPTIGNRTCKAAKACSW